LVRNERKALNKFWPVKPKPMLSLTIVVVLKPATFDRRIPGKSKKEKSKNLSQQNDRGGCE
jgi:hypothetical protein